ncbi:nuclear transport factor 2 family protein [Corynebacterium sp. sy017]|uniref:nuclear transport factor 2 family protein n=1 Tax=unclassified Corynebacterium TaxID=2624378 RepID=UPI001184B934|nr:MULTISPECIES: nuclear transport factor 2 family protein [unclassified Corynebacterium]MBP3089090.1 nuclear transport factor 2 family protein [Corynebacterium sp. sy017]TSD91404.1 nuclear transport factor 2 family protein [Corynebacterium sp. SY003]
MDIHALHETLCTAMLTADTEALDALLAEDFTLTHMTGYVQPKEEWLAQITSGEMAYHSMDTVELSLVDDVTFRSRTHTRATIWGMHGTWPLQLTSHCQQDDDGSWIIRSTVATTW